MKNIYVDFGRMNFDFIRIMLGFFFIMLYLISMKQIWWLWNESCEWNEVNYWFYLAKSILEIYFINILIIIMQINIIFENRENDMIRNTVFQTNISHYLKNGWSASCACSVVPSWTDASFCSWLDHWGLVWGKARWNMDQSRL